MGYKASVSHKQQPLPHGSSNMWPSSSCWSSRSQCCCSSNTVLISHCSQSHDTATVRSTTSKNLQSGAPSYSGSCCFISAGQVYMLWWCNLYKPFVQCSVMVPPIFGCTAAEAIMYWQASLSRELSKTINDNGSVLLAPAHTALACR